MTNIMPFKHTVSAKLLILTSLILSGCATVSQNKDSSLETSTSATKPPPVLKPLGHIIMTRHGLVDGKTLCLNSEGSRYSNYLARSLKYNDFDVDSISANGAAGINGATCKRVVNTVKQITCDAGSKCKPITELKDSEEFASKFTDLVSDIRADHITDAVLGGRREDINYLVQNNANVNMVPVSSPEAYANFWVIEVYKNSLVSVPVRTRQKFQTNVECYIYDGGDDCKSNPTSNGCRATTSITFDLKKEKTALAPTAGAGQSGKYAGQCYVKTKRGGKPYDQVSWLLYDDAFTNISPPVSGVEIKGVGKSCVPGGTTCRRWFGRGETSAGGKVTCEVYNDGHTDPTDPSMSFTVSGSNKIVIPRGATTRRWFGNCVAKYDDSSS